MFWNSQVQFSVNIRIFIKMTHHPYAYEIKSNFLFNEHEEKKAKNPLHDLIIL